MRIWRLLDTGVRTAAENMALDEAILEARSRSLIPNTVRFLQFSPDAVLVGYHQSVAQEVRVEYCRERGFDINRRITGGGAILFDRTSLGWELIASKEDLNFSPRLEGLFRRICSAVVLALRNLGLNAQFRPRNDIEVCGKKISGTGGTEMDNAFLFQGTLLIDFRIEDMLRALRIPTEKLKDKEIESFRERVTCLRWELGDLPPLDSIKSAIARGFEKTFGIDLEASPLTSDEESLLASKLHHFESPEWIYRVKAPPDEQGILRSIYRARGGVIRTALVANPRRKRIGSVMFTGDFFSFPRRAIPDLEAALKDAPADPRAIEERVRAFFLKSRNNIMGVTPEDFVSAILMATEKMRYSEYGISLSEANSIFTVVRPFEAIVQTGASVLLLPYCAKSIDCKFRYTKECSICSNCSIGIAWEIARRAGMEVETIVNYEDLERTLAGYKSRGVAGFVGCCCEAFLAKHRGDFERIGLPGILIDIDSSTCYDLGKEREALRGSFDNQTHLKLDLLEKVVGIAAPRGDLDRPGATLK
ncbi:MAG: lipoyl protein ligase domain-containing protein [bacterium]